MKTQLFKRWKISCLFSNDSTFHPRSNYVMWAIIISIVSILWNIPEGIISIFFGARVESVALATFGVNSLVEIASSIIILWRFLTEPSMENSEDHIEATLVKERKATLAIGIFFIFLALGTFAASITSLVQHTHPDPSVSGVIISSISLLIMLLLFIVKRVLAKKLDSSAMASEASCSLACLKITIVLFLGSLIYRLSSKTWWIDASAALILGCMFAMEGVDLVIWSNSKAFHGGCKKKLKNNEKFLPEMSTTIDVPNEYANNNSISQ